jgi:hypothetical protein
LGEFIGSISQFLDVDSNVVSLDGLGLQC